ncbi:hypothetical protein [Pararhizobium sp. LjRoot238]|uniref:hypothetical protein n=1 Tax=Pararhizobium sp. LjRoot238 TaxID=3342293 RepID=UPI003ECDE0D0
MDEKKPPNSFAYLAHVLPKTLKLENELVLRNLYFHSLQQNVRIYVEKTKLDTQRHPSMILESLMKELSETIEKSSSARTDFWERAAHSVDAEPPSSFWFGMMLPSDVGDDFLANMEIKYQEKWLPAFGARRAKWMWRRQCMGMVVRYWFDTLVSAAESLRKIIW